MSNLKSLILLGLAAAFITQSGFSQVSVPLPGRVINKLLPDYGRPKVYALNQANGSVPGTLLALNPTNGTVLAEISLNVNPTDMAIAPTGDALYVIHAGSRTISKVDLATFSVTAEKAITTPSSYNLSNPLYVAAGQSERLYYTDGAWGPQIYLFDFNAGTNQLVLNTGGNGYHGAGGIVLNRTGSKLYTWAQYGWSAGNVNSWVTRYDVSTNGTLASLETSFTSWRRDPFDTPLFLDAAERWIFNKQQMFSATNVSILLNQFTNNIYGISLDGSIAFGPKEVFNTLNANTLTNLPFSTTVQTLSGDQKKLFRYQASTTSIVIYDMAIIASVSGPNPIPTPANGAVVSLPLTNLNWTVSPPALAYDVYFGTNQSAVASASNESELYLGRTSSPSKAIPGSLLPGVTYYWRVNVAGFSTTNTGPVWSFTTSTLLVDPVQINAFAIAGYNPASVSIQLTGASPWTARVTGSNWLSITPTNGTTPSQVTLNFNTTALPAGLYSNNINFTVNGVTLPVPVSLNVKTLNITKMVADTQRPYIYAIQPPAFSGQSGLLLFINTTNGNVNKTLSIGINPVDLAINRAEDKLYVASWGEAATYVVDLQTQTLLPSLNLGTDVYKINAGAQGRLITEGMDQWISGRLINTTNGSALASILFREGDGAFDPTGRYYYHVDNNSSGAAINKYDMNANTFALVTGNGTRGSYYGSRNLVISQDGSRLFWTRVVFDANLVSYDMVPGEVYACSTNGRVAFGATQAYDSQTRQVIYNLPVSSTVSVVDGQNQRFWYFANNVLGSVPMSIISPTEPVNIFLSGNSIRENQPVGAIVGLFTAADTNVNDVHTFTLVSGDGSANNASFRIDGNVLKTTAIFDVDAQASYSIRVRATDSGGLFYERTFTITVEAAGHFPISWGSSPSWGQTTVPPGLENVSAVAGGAAHTLALKPDGTVLTWGANLSGYIVVPAPAGLSNVTAIAASDLGDLVLKNDGTVVAWGANDVGQTNVPAGLTNVIAIAAGRFQNVALKNDGTVVVWGANDAGQRNVPAGLTNVVAISSGYRHVMALKSDGTVVAWGHNGNGQTNKQAGLSNVVAIASGANYNLALRSNGTVYGWGSNTYGERTFPSGLNNVRAISAYSGASHSMALKSNGTIVAWGNNQSQQITLPSGLTNVTAISMGQFGGFALNDGSPVIRYQPARQDVTVRSTANFSVTAEGEALTYRWQKNGVDLFDSATISGTGTATLTVLAGFSDAGLYTVVVSNAMGKITSSPVDLTVVCPDIYIEPYLSQGSLGASYSETLYAFSGTEPYTYAVTSNTLPPGLSLTTDGVLSGIAGAPGDFSFEITATDVDGCSKSSVLSLSIIPASSSTDTNPATLKITAPLANQRITNNFNVLVKGTATDTDPGVASVIYRVNNSEFKMAEGTTNWSAMITPTAGTNIVEVKAIDFCGNETVLMKRLFFEVVHSQLTLSVNGEGTVLGSMSSIGQPADGAFLEVGRSYTIKATPGSGQILSNWTGTVEYTNLTSLAFVMRSNMVLQANFIPNPFIPLKGAYSGLFYETNVPSGITHHSAGFFNLVVNTNASYSGKAVFDGDTISFSGKFHVNGTVTKVLPRAALGKADVQLSLTLDNNQLNGSVSEDVNWTAELKADRNLWGATNPATAYTNNYTLLLPGASYDFNAPSGYSYMTLSINTNGMIKAAGTMADGLAFSQSVPVSAAGEWPFYVPLYRSVRIYTNLLKTTNLWEPVLATNKSYYRGSALGWLVFNPVPTNEISWIKTEWTNAIYTGGFTHQMAAMSSIYRKPLTGVRALDAATGTVTLTDGNLVEGLTRYFTNSPGNKLTITPTNQLVKLTLTTASGVLSGTFRHPDNDNKSTVIKGVILQDQKVGGGSFIGVDRAGKMLLEGE